MKKILPHIGLILLFVVIIQTGCITQSKCNRRFPVQTHDSVVYKDTTIYKHDTVYVPTFEFGFDTIGIIPDNINFSHTEKKKNITASVHIKKGKLTVMCKEDSLRAIIESKDRIITNYTSIKEVVYKTEFIQHWYDKPLLYWGITSLIIILLIFTWRYITGFVSSIFKSK